MLNYNTRYMHFENFYQTIFKTMYDNKYPNNPSDNRLNDREFLNSLPSGIKTSIIARGNQINAAAIKILSDNGFIIYSHTIGKYWTRLENDKEMRSRLSQVNCKLQHLYGVILTTN